MPVDEGTGVRPAAKPKPRPDEGTRGLTPKPQPHPVLQARFNFHGSVEEFNRRLEVIDKSHSNTLGYKPSAQLAYEIAKSPVKDEQVPRLFEVPRTKKAAAAVSFVKPDQRGVLQLQDPISRTVAKSEEFAPTPLTEDELLTGLAAAARKGRKAYQAFRDEYQSQIEAADAKYGVGQSPFDLRNQPREVSAAAVGPIGLADEIAGTVMVAGLQIGSALVLGPPTIALEEGRAVKKSVEQKSLRPLGEANYKLAEAAVTGFYNDGKAIVTRDWEYIKANPGFIALDVLGLGSLVGKLGRAAGGTKTLRKGGVEVEALRSENPAAAMVQDVIRNRRQKAADKRHDTEDIIDHSKLGFFFQKNFGFERKIGRELERQRQLEIALRDMVRADLDRVTGWSERAARARDAVGVKAHRGLTRGEQMALFIESLDVSGSWADRAAALRRAHEGWIRDGIGDPAAHQQKLRDIALAEKAHRKQSPRFTQALQLTREAVAEMEAIKVRELGLDASVASERVARAGEVVRTGERLEDFGRPARAREDSFYVPTVPPRKSRPLAKSPYRPKRFGQYGAAVPEMRRLVPELSHQFEGKAFRAGDYRIDTTRLVGESVGRTVRAASVLSQYRTLLKAATDKPRSEFDRPIRVDKGVPDELRAILARTDEGELVADEVAALSKADADAMLKELFPGQRGQDGRWLVDRKIEGVKWVDERLIDPEAWTQPMPTKFVQGMDALNALPRFVTLYLRPAYILNLLGATTSAFIYQGLLAPPNIARAVFAGKLYGKKVENGLRDLVGGGRAISYVKDRPVTNTTKAVARFWNTITDERIRMSMAIYYGRKQGIKTRKDWEDLLDGAKAGDDKAFNTLSEVVDRAKKSAVQFDNLTWAEQNLLRHAIFIYPWTRGAAVWSLRTIVERPVTSAVLAQIGADAADDAQDIFTERVPEWFKNAGYLPFGYEKDGSPRVVNPASLNTFSTLNSLMHSRVEQLLGPAGEIAVRGATERDEFGNEYPSATRLGRWRDALLDVGLGLPQLAAMERSRRQDKTIPAPDVSDRGSLSKRVNDALKLTVFSPGWLDGYGQLVTGGLTPRTVNEEALLARWSREATPEERTKLQKELVNRALGLQADLLGRGVDLDVRRLINLQFDLDAKASAKERELARDLTPMERTLLDLERLAPEGEREKLKKQAGRLSAEEHEAFRRDLFNEFADPEGRLKEWDESVRRVNALATPSIVNERLRRLTESGVNDAAASAGRLSREQLLEYGRKSDAYARELKRRVLEIAQLRKSDPDRVAAAEADLIAWKSEQDRPVSVAGVRLPSPARMEWAKEWNFEERKQDVALLASRPWSGLTRLEKELLGKKVDPAIARGWQRLEQIKAEQLAALPAGRKSIPERHLVTLAKYVDRHYVPGFFQDFLFSRRPLFRRLETFRPIRESANTHKWKQLFEYAKTYESRRTEGVVKDTWREYVKDSLKPWIDADPSFKSEVDLYGSNVVASLLD